MAARHPLGVVRDRAARLFEEPDAAAQADIAAVARVFTEFYARHRGEFPNGVAEPAYEERIKAAYPIHPELFDRLYQDWSTLERFQRTRGVLRLMSAVIHTLWHARRPRAADHAGWRAAGLRPGPQRDRPSTWRTTSSRSSTPTSTATDSTPARSMDEPADTSASGKITRRIARAIFLGSAPTLKAAHKGIEQPSIWLGVAVPGDTVGNFGSALHLLSDQATYLYSDGARYWYDTQASVARLAREHADRLRDRPDEILGGDPAPAPRARAEHQGHVRPGAGRPGRAAARSPMTRPSGW